MRQRLLWVTDEVPDPDFGGGSIRQYQLLRHVAERADIDLVMVGHLRDDDLRRSLKRVLEIAPAPDPAPWRQWLIDRQSALPGRDPTEIRLARPKVDLLRPHLAVVECYDVVQIEHAGLASLLPQQRPRLKRVITLHNLISVRMGQLADVAHSERVRWLLRRDSARAKRLERWIINNYDLTVVMSDDDAATVGGGAVVVPNGVDLDRFERSDLPSLPVLIFAGTFSYGPNIDAASWLCHEILPQVRASVPEVLVLLVGREPHAEVRRLADVAGVEVHFDVPSIVPYLRSARVALAPLRAGSGTRLKVLEAMAAGRPVAGTAIGVEGLGLDDGRSAAIADTSEELASRIVRLCRDDDHARRLSDAARRLAESRFGWDTVADSYADQVLTAPPDRAV